MCRIGEATDALSRDSQSRRNPYNPIIFWGSKTNFFFQPGSHAAQAVLGLAR